MDNAKHIKLLIVIFIVGFIICPLAAFVANQRTNMVLSADTLILEGDKPEILIFKETYVDDYLRGGTSLLVEYSVNGIVQNALFSIDEHDAYLALIDHLEAVGRLKRVTP